MSDQESEPTSAPNKNKQSVGEIILEEIIAPPRSANRWRRLFQAALIPFLAILTGLLMGAILIVVTSPEVFAGFRESFLAGLRAVWRSVAVAYGALLTGAFGTPQEIVAAFRSGELPRIYQAIYPITESLVAAAPYIFAGLSVALGFRTGLFNIGAEGQIFLGAIFSVFVGYSLKGLPMIVHLPLAFLAGAVGGGLWGFIPGWLKARTGAHEVINTIMLNYIAFRLSDWLLTGPMKRPGSANPVSPMIEPSAMLPTFFGSPVRLHLGFIIALLVAWLIHWYLFKTRWGFNLRTVGANPSAAKYAGINVLNGMVVAMSLAGALAGLAGANEVLGVNRHLAMAFSSGYGFDAIALALLGNSQPLGVVLASLLFGALRNGATKMQLVADIPIDIISIVQAFVLVFVAAPAIIRAIYRLRKPPEAEEAVVAASWGGK